MPYRLATHTEGEVSAILVLCVRASILTQRYILREVPTAFFLVEEVVAAAVMDAGDFAHYGLA